MSEYSYAKDCITGELQKEAISFKLDDVALKEYKRFKEAGKLEEEIFQELTIQFLFFLSFYTSGPEGIVFLTKNSILPFYSRGRLYGLLYRDCFVYLVYLHDTYESKVAFQRRFWKNLFRNVSDLQEKQSFRFLSEGRNSICNRIPEEFGGIYDLEKEINGFIEDDMKLGNPIEIELFMPRKTLECFFEIKAYIISVFSFIEYLGNCLLPFWEADRSDGCYDYFISSCHDKNEKINSWRDLLDESKNDPQTYGRNSWEKTKPRRIEIVNLIIDAINFTYLKTPYGYIKEEYHSLKDAYRNMLTHGSMGIHFFYGFSDGEVNLNSYHVFTEGTANHHMIEFDYHSFKRVKLYFDAFLGTVKYLFPAAFEYIFSGLDIPVDATEFIRLCGKDRTKIDAYLEVIRVKGVFDQLQFLFAGKEKTEENYSMYIQMAYSKLRKIKEFAAKGKGAEDFSKDCSSFYLERSRILGVDWDKNEYAFKTLSHNESDKVDTSSSSS